MGKGEPRDRETETDRDREKGERLGDVQNEMTPNSRCVVCEHC